MEWIKEVQEERQEKTDRRKLQMLEVGCLSPDNAMAKAKTFEVTRIDLNSQHPSIEKQDFMERPLPGGESEKFDIVSLSLVLNYVPDPTGRGEMLRRTARFLRGSAELDPEDPVANFFPSVFLVLPAPCITNSRYLNETRLEEIMKSIGYELVKSKVSAKLVYGLWRLSDPGALARRKKFKKEVVNSGKTRNNFAVVLT
jgi:25S rRNA (adenine2142-N1)-methyltransferase